MQCTDVLVLVCVHIIPCMQEKSFTTFNKQVMEGTLSCISTLLSAKTSPEKLLHDCIHVSNVLKAETVRVDDLAASLQFLEGLKKTTDQCLVWVSNVITSHSQMK